MYRFFYRKQEKEVSCCWREHEAQYSYQLCVVCLHMTHMWKQLLRFIQASNTTRVHHKWSWIQASYPKSMFGCNESMILLRVKRCPPVLPLEGFKEKIPKEAHDKCVWHQFLLAAAKTKFAFTHWGVGPDSRVILVKDNQINGTTHVQNIHFILYTLHAGHTILHWMMNFLCQLVETTTKVGVPKTGNPPYPGSRRPDEVRRR